MLVIQHVPKENTAAVYHPGRLIPFLDIHSQDRDMKTFFVDPVHTLVGKNGQKIEIELFLIRTARAEQRIFFIDTPFVWKGLVTFPKRDAAPIGRRARHASR